MGRRSSLGWIVALVLAVAALGVNVWLGARLVATEHRLDTMQVQAEAAQADIAEATRRADAATRGAEDVQRQLDASYRTAGLLLDFVGTQLEGIETQSITITVPISEQLPIQTEILFDETFQVPIQTTVPISTSVRVPLQLGVFGTFNLDVPIRTDVPINLDIAVPFRKEIPIETTVPIRLDVPLTLSLQDTSLASQLEAWRTGLDDLRGAFPTSDE